MNILVCFNDNDCMITRINCTLEEAKDYYINNDFSYWSGEHNKEESHESRFVLDVDKEFKVSYSNNVLDEMTYQLKGVNFSELILENKTLGEETIIEPNWFWKSNNRIIKQ